jgi:hypothetical protein
MVIQNSSSIRSSRSRNTKKRIQDSTIFIPGKEGKSVKLPFDPKSTKGLQEVFKV